MINDESHPNFFLSYINPICAHHFLLKAFFKIFTFEKIPDFPSEGLKLVILQHKSLMLHDSQKIIFSKIYFISSNMGQEGF